MFSHNNSHNNNFGTLGHNVKLGHSYKEFGSRVSEHVTVYVPSPIVVCAWLMAIMLWQQFEYYIKLLF